MFHTAIFRLPLVHPRAVGPPPGRQEKGLRFFQHAVQPHCTVLHHDVPVLLSSYCSHRLTILLLSSADAHGRELVLSSVGISSSLDSAHCGRQPEVGGSSADSTPAGLAGSSIRYLVRDCSSTWRTYHMCSARVRPPKEERCYINNTTESFANE